MNIARQLNRLLSLRGWLALLIWMTQAFAAWSGGLPKDYISREVQWLAHLDMDAFRKSGIYQYLEKNHQLSDIMHSSMSFNDEKFSLDFTKCNNLSLFGDSVDLDEELIGGVIQMSPAYRQEILDFLKKMSKAEEEFLTPIKKHKNWHGFNMDDEVYVYSPKTDAFVFGSEKYAEQICKQVTGKSRAKGPPLVEEMASGTPAFLLVSFKAQLDENFDLPLDLTIKPEFNRNLTNALMHLEALQKGELLKALAGGSLRIGEVANHLSVEVVCKTKTDEQAEKLQSAFKVALQLLVNEATLGKEAWPFFQGIKVQQEAQDVKISVLSPLKMGDKYLLDILGMAAKSPVPAPAKTAPATQPANRQ